MRRNSLVIAATLTPLFALAVSCSSPSNHSFVGAWQWAAGAESRSECNTTAMTGVTPQLGMFEVAVGTASDLVVDFDTKDACPPTKLTIDTASPDVATAVAGQMCTTSSGSMSVDVKTVMAKLTLDGDGGSVAMQTTRFIPRDPQPIFCTVDLTGKIDRR
jgi:hypothetical protein